MTVKNREKREQRTVSAKRRVQEHRSGYRASYLKVPNGCSFFDVKKAGRLRIDIIPYKVGKGNPFADEGQLHYERTFHTHRGIGADNSSYICLARTFKKPCPVCEWRARELQDPDSKFSEKTLDSFKPKERQLFNILDHAEPEKGVQVFEFAWWNFGKHLDAKVENADPEDKERFESFADPKVGSTLKIGVTEGTGGDFTFYDCGDIEFTARKKPLDSTVLKGAFCLDDILKPLSYDALKKAFLQGFGDTDGEETASDSDEDEETEDEDTDEEEGEDEEESEDEEPEEEEEEETDETASDLGIEQGCMVRHAKYGTCVVIKVSKDGTSLILEDEDGDIKKAVAPSAVALIDQEEEEEEPESEDEEEDDESSEDEELDEEGEEEEEGEQEEGSEEEEEEEPESRRPAPKKPGSKKPGMKKPGKKPSTKRPGKR